VHPQGLPLDILPEDSKTLCLRDAQGDALSCIQLSAVVQDPGDTDAQHLIRQFHQGTFSLAYDISPSQRLALLGNSVIFSGQGNSNAQQQIQQQIRQPVPQPDQ
jgi:hypothetical protein